MKVFHCDHCQHTVFFENVNCGSCGHVLAYLPDIGDIAALDPLDGGLWRSLAPQSQGGEYRLCENYTGHGVCNWAVRADDPSALCLACRLTRVLPNLDGPGHLDAWRRIEIAKRRVVYSLLVLQLPIQDRNENPARGLAYDFLSDAPETGAEPVLTGHEDGVITLNIAEADDVEREKRRLSLHEPYRTLLGHFRHEIGHYYWDMLIDGSDRLDAFRAMFGDEREDYAEALKRHYEGGAPADWQSRYVSAYASSHPWEDWAETWAHYLHMSDSLETASACGVSVQPNRPDVPVLEHVPAVEAPAPPPFDVMIEHWLALTYALNNLNRSLGQPDGYPFVLAPAAIEKLRFVHDTLHAPRETQAAAPLAAAA